MKTWERYARERPMRTADLVRQLLAAARFRLPAAMPASLPVLVLASEKDRLVHPECSRKLAQALQCELRTHPQAGHDLPLDAPDWVIGQTLGWCESKGAGSMN